MKKVSNEEELQASLKILFEKSAILLAQAFTPTEFDWRVGLLNGVPLYACKYYMAKGHWQIYCHYDSGRSRCGLVDTIPIYQVPRVVLDTAVKAANLIGKGLYGVDLKMVDDRAYVIEINVDLGADIFSFSKSSFRYTLFVHRMIDNGSSITAIPFCAANCDKWNV